MNKFKLLSILLSLTVVGAMAQNVPPPQTSFSSQSDCSMYFYNYANNLPTNVDISYYFFFSRFGLSSNSFTTTTRCQNGQCLWQFYFNASQATPPTPKGGACSLVGTVFWPQAVENLQSAYSTLQASQGKTPINEPTSYGIYCSNTTGQNPPSNFQGCQLLSR